MPTSARLMTEKASSPAFLYPTIFFRRRYMKNLFKLTQIDIARQKETLPVIFRFFDVAKKSGFDGVLMYIEDRVKTESYPYPSEEESYTPDEIREMVSYAEKLDLELIPHVNNLSHTERFLSHKELLPLSELYGNIQGRFNKAGEAFYHATCASNEKVFEFFNKYFEEVASLFPSEYFSVGFDEYFDIASCDKCRERFEKDGGFGKIFLQHIIKTNSFLNSIGKKMIMADDMFYFCSEILPEIPKNITMQSWCYEFIDRAQLGQFRNNRRVEFFKEYDRLGIEYLVSTWTNFDFNTDSYVDFGKRYNPSGILATCWGMSSEQILYQLPLVAYTGLLLKGMDVYKPFERMKKAVMMTMDVTEDEASPLALAVASAPINRAPRQYFFADDIIVRKNVNFDEWHKTQVFLLDALKNIKDKNDMTLQAYMRAELAVVMYETMLRAQRIIDYRSGMRNDDMEEIKKDLLSYRKILENRFKIQKEKWEVYRPGIPNDKIFEEEEIMLGDIDTLIEKADKASCGECGCMDLTIVMPDKSIRMITEVIATYEDGEKRTLARGVFKPLYTSNYNISEKGPFIFNLTALAEDVQNIRELTVSHTGFGECLNAFVCLRHGKETFVPTKILNTQGRCITPENMLVNDTRCATFGFGDMNYGFENRESADIAHCVTFKMEREKKWNLKIRKNSSHL